MNTSPGILPDTLLGPATPVVAIPMTEPKSLPAALETDAFGHLCGNFGIYRALISYQGR
jgi:hypothetical protein